MLRSQVQHAGTSRLRRWDRPQPIRKCSWSCLSGGSMSQWAARLLKKDLLVDGSCSNERWSGMRAAQAGVAVPSPLTSAPRQGDT